MRKLVVSIPEYDAMTGRTVRAPQNFADFLARVQRPGGYWRIVQRDKATGVVQAEQWCENTYTDHGVSTMFSAIAGVGPTFTSTPGNILAIDQSLGMTTLSSSIASGGTVTAINVNAPTGPNIPSGTVLLIDPGSGHANFTVTLTQTINGAGSFTVTSTTGPATLIASGAVVRYDKSSVPTADPTSLSAPVSYTAALPGGQIVQTLTSGYGNRQLAINNSGTYLFSTTGSPAATSANYTCAYLCNASPVTANTTFIRVAFDLVLSINSTTTGEVSLVEKL